MNPALLPRSTAFRLPSWLGGAGSDTRPGAAGFGFACQHSHTFKGTTCPAPVPVIHPVSCDQ